MKTYLYGAAAAVLLLGGVSAQAADLGGNCCADLEERIAELEATTARKGNRKVSLEVSGQINEAVFWADGSDPVIINNPNSSGRWRFRGAGKINSDWSAGFLLEINSHHNVSPTHNAAAAIAAQSIDLIDPNHQLSIRHQALYVKSKTIGTFWLGHTSTATDGISEISLDASIASTLASPSLLGGNVMDGSRAPGVKWISPDLGGFSVAAAWQDNDAWDAALRFAAEFNSIRFAAGVGYAKDNERERISGSASLMHTPSGLFVSGMYGRANDGFEFDLFDIDGEADATQYGIRAGLSRKLSPLGKTTLYGEYSFLDVKGEGELSWFGGALIQHIDAAAMEIYVAGRRLDDGEENATEFLVGSRIRF